MVLIWLTLKSTDTGLSCRFPRLTKSKQNIDLAGEKLSTFYLFQSISIAIQKGNAQCVTGCVKERSSGLEGLFNFHVQEAEEL